MQILCFMFLYFFRKWQFFFTAFFYKFFGHAGEDDVQAGNNDDAKQGTEQHAAGGCRSNGPVADSAGAGSYHQRY